LGGEAQAGPISEQSMTGSVSKDRKEIKSTADDKLHVKCDAVGGTARTQGVTGWERRGVLNEKVTRDPSLMPEGGGKRNGMREIKGVGGVDSGKMLQKKKHREDRRKKRSVSWSIGWGEELEDGGSDPKQG